MSRLNPEKLSVEFREGVTKTTPIIPRRYTLTHSDTTAQLFLTIGPSFAFDQLTEMRDEVLGEWLFVENTFRYYVYLQVGGDFGQEIEDIRNLVFRRELPLALEAIRYGDREYFETHRMDQLPIIVYFLYPDPSKNIAENWGTFEEYNRITSDEQMQANSFGVGKVLIEEKFGDVNGDGIVEKISLHGLTLEDSDYVQSLTLNVVSNQSGFGWDAFTEVSAYRPVLFLGDFTKDGIVDIKISFEEEEIGGYQTFLYSYQNNEFVLIFDSGRYNSEFRFLAEYRDNYTISVFNVKLNQIYYLDISYKGIDYLSRYYSSDGKLLRPMQVEVLNIQIIQPIVSKEQENFYDLLAIHPMIGETDHEILGYFENQLSWNGELFDTARTRVSTPGTTLIP